MVQVLINDIPTILTTCQVGYSLYLTKELSTDSDLAIDKKMIGAHLVILAMVVLLGLDPIIAYTNPWMKKSDWLYWIQWVILGLDALISSFIILLILIL